MDLNDTHSIVSTILRANAEQKVTIMKAIVHNSTVNLQDTYGNTEILDTEDINVVGDAIHIQTTFDSLTSKYDKSLL